MTAHVHDPATPAGAAADAAPAGRRPVASTRPRWLLPGVVGAIAVAVLVVGGVVPLSTALYAGLFGGMILMHLGGHGHGGHGSGHGGHGGHGPAPDAGLRSRSAGSQPVGAGSEADLDGRASHDDTTSETERHDHGSHSCH